MALRCDIFWLGRQWAVTGYGIQAVNKKLDMKFDIEASRLLEEGLAGPHAFRALVRLGGFHRSLRVCPETSGRIA